MQLVETKSHWRGAQFGDDWGTIESQDKEALMSRKQSNSCRFSQFTFVFINYGNSIDPITIIRSRKKRSRNFFHQNNSKFVSVTLTQKPANVWVEINDAVMCISCRTYGGIISTYMSSGLPTNASLRYTE